MSRRGFALLAVLWALVAASVFGGVALAIARTGVLTTRNRILLARASWAREACVEIARSRYLRDPEVRLVDTVDLGRGTWCRVAFEDPASQLNLNLADAEDLALVLGNDSLAAALLDWRDPDTVPRPSGAEAAWYRERGRREPRNAPLADVAELAYVKGFDSVVLARLEPLLTTRGKGVVNINAAPPAVLATLPGMTYEAVATVLADRAAGRHIESADQLAGELTKSGSSALLSQYAAFVARAVMSSPLLVARAQGGVRMGDRVIIASATLTLVPVGSRLAVVRRETE